VTETYHIVNTGRRLAGLEVTAPKNGMRFHFELPGSVQGFQPEDSIEAKGVVSVENVTGHSQQGQRSLAIHYHGLVTGRAARVATPTFIPTEDTAVYFEKRGYRLISSPTLYSGQTIEAGVQADGQNPVQVNLYMRVFGADDNLTTLRGPQIEAAPGRAHVLRWQAPDTGGAPIAEVGVEISSEQRADGTLYLDYLGWTGTPDVTLRRPDHPGKMWRRAWVNGLDHEDRREMVDYWPDTYRVIQDEGRGLLIQGAREWTDYEVSAPITPHLFKAGGLAARVQGMRRYYALLLSDQSSVQLVKALDGERVLAEAPFIWQFGQTYTLSLRVQGSRIVAAVDGKVVLDYTDEDRPLTGGAIALVCEEGRFGCDSVRIQP
jgi:hypothetical protein